MGEERPGRTDTHIHVWQIDRHNTGTCSLCGEVRQFPWEPEVRQLFYRIPNEHHRRITQVSKKDHPSIKQVSKREGNMAISNMEKHQRYEKLKEDILADLQSIGRPATRKKHGIPSGTMSQLELRWLTLQERQALSLVSNTSRGRPVGSKTVATTPTNDHLPSFPEFSNDWAESVQFKWFEIYEMLRGIQSPS